MRKKLALLLLAVVLVGCGNSAEMKKEEVPVEAETAVEEAEVAKENIVEETPEMPTSNEIQIGDTFNIGKHEMTITNAELVKDYEGKNTLKLTYTFTNNSEETVAPFMEWSGKLFQNGVEESDFFASDEIDLGIGQKDIRPGTTLEDCQMGFSLSDMSPVEIEFDEFMSFKSNPYILKLNPTEL